MKANSVIRQAMETHLQTLDPDFATAWENKDFKPTDAPFQVPTFLFAEPDDRGFRDSPFTQRGILTVTLAFPLNEGPGKAEAKAEEVRNYYDRGLSLLTSEGFSVVVDRTPEITGGEVQENRYIIRVRIRFYAHIDKA
jgi:hypothetical protein